MLTIIFDGNKYDGFEGLILGETPTIDISSLGLDRFEKNELVFEPSVV